MALSDILEAPLFYDQDVKIVLSDQKIGQTASFRYGICDQIQHWTFDEHERTVSEINQFLVERRYRPVNKRTDEAPFAPCWDYRLMAPTWQVFRNWLSSYYVLRHDEAIRMMATFANDRFMKEFYKDSVGRAEAYTDILIHLRDVQLDFEPLWQWTAS